ncbi:hypothetical protein AHAS_Ahas20G0188800 [Arachis hypogaea]
MRAFEEFTTLQDARYEERSDIEVDKVICLEDRVEETMKKAGFWTKLKGKGKGETSKQASEKKKKKDKQDKK